MVRFEHVLQYLQQTGGQHDPRPLVPRVGPIVSGHCVELQFVGDRTAQSPQFDRSRNCRLYSHWLVCLSRARWQRLGGRCGRRVLSTNCQGVRTRICRHCRRDYSTARYQAGLGLCHALCHCGRCVWVCVCVCWSCYLLVVDCRSHVALTNSHKT